MQHHGLPAMTNDEAWMAMDGLQADKRIGWANEPRGIETSWKQYTRRSSPSPKLWMDAYLAAFAVTGGYQFVTTDQAFKQFHGLNLIVLVKTSIT